MAALGSVVVELSANIAKFQSDMGRAAAIAEQRAREIDKHISLIKNTLGALGVGFAFSATFDTIKAKIEGAIASAAGLQQLSERTGSAVEQLSGLAAVAKLSGTGTDELATGLQKLAKAQIDAQNGGQKTSESFKAIGISIADIQGKRPDETFKLIADRLNAYQDGAEKVTIAQNLLGKSGANLLPVFKDLAEVGDLQIKVTAEQAAQADELEKNQIRLRASTDAIFKKIGLELLPVFNAFTKTLLESQNANDGVRKSIGDLAADGSIRSWAEGAAQAAGFVIDAFDGVSRVVQIVGKYIGSAAAAVGAIARGEFGQVKGIAADAAADIDAILQKQLFSDRLKKQLDASRNAAAPAAIPRAAIDTSGLGNDNTLKGPKDDPTKKILEGQLKAQEEFIAAEKTLLATREKYLDFYQNLEYFSLRDAELKKQAIVADNLKVVQAAYDTESALIRSYIAQAAKLTDKEDGRNKLAEVAKKRVAAEVEASTRIIDSQNKLLAVQRQFDLATRERARQDAIANSSAQFAIDMMGKNTLEVLKATEARSIQLQLEERIVQLRKQDPGADASKAMAQAAIQTARAQALITEQYDKQRAAIFGANEALRKYGEDAGNAAAQVENAMTNAFKGMEDALVSFVTTGKLDFQSLANSIIADIARIIVKQALVGAFGSGGGSSSGSSTVSTLGLLGSLFSGTRATGGPVSAGGLYQVNERGPELLNMAGKQYLMMSSQGGSVTPNGGAAMSGDTINVTQNFTVGDVASVSLVRQAVAGSEGRIASALGRSQRYGGALA